MATILIVDDRPVNREFLVTLLGYKGHRLIEAAHGAEALEQARTWLPDLIITDLLMPMMDGYEFVRQLRVEPDLALTPIIFYTAHYREEEAQALAQACGVPYLLPKPSKPEVVLSMVETALGSTLPAVSPPPPEAFDREHLRLLTNKLSEKVDELRRVNARLSALIDINLQLASEQDPQRLLKSFCHMARELLGAKVGTVSVLGEGEQVLHYFFTSGMDAATTAQLGAHPLHGDSRLLLRERRAYRLLNPGGNPETVGFPSTYPPIHSLLVAPILSPSQVYGWLCLIDKVGLEEFSAEDEQLATSLATLVGQIYDNRQLYAELMHQTSELEQREASFRHLFANHPHPMWVYDLETLQFLEVNGAAVNYYGYSVDDFRRMRITDIRPPEDIPALLEDLQQDRLPLQRSDQWRHLLKDGRIIDVEITSHTLEFAGRKAALVVAQDITERKRAEAQFQLAVEASPQAIVLVNTEGKLSLVNAQAETLFGYSREELLGQPVELLVPPEFRTHHNHYRDTFLAAPTTRPMGAGRDLYGLRRDGSQVPIEIGLNPITTAQGSLVLVSIIDITERKRAEQALQESESRFRQLADSLPQLVWTCQPDGPCDYLSQQWVAFTGLSEAEQLGFGWLEQLHPDDREPTIAAWNDAVASGSDFQVEFRIRRHDGLYRWFDTRAVRLRDGEGHTIKWFGSNTDITDRKRAEETLRTNEQKLRTLFTLLPVGISILDQESHVVAANPALEQILGLSSQELAAGSHNRRKYLRPDGAPLPSHEFPTALAVKAQREVANVEIGIVKENGQTIWTNVSAIPVTFSDWRVVTAIVDITERKQAEEGLKQMAAELARSNAELEQFAYVASHDLQEPLRAVAGTVQLLQKRYQGQLDARADEFITHAVDGVTRMQTLINDLLSYSRVGTRGQPFVLTDSAAILRDVLADLAIAIQERDAIVTSDALPAVMADPTQLRQLLQNLIGNALKFHGESPPEIHLSAERHEDEWLFAVCDNGIGMEAQYFERIFGIFQRLHTRRAYPGTGIGLAICKKIVERHGGRIWVEAEAGQGSIFYFTLPERR